MKLTLWFSLAVVAVIVAFDLWTISAHGYDTTISAVGYQFARNYPIIPFALGVVVGHLYWPNQAAAERQRLKREAAYFGPNT